MIRSPQAFRLCGNDWKKADAPLCWTPMHHDHLTAFCETNLPATLDSLRRMVAINSFTTHPEGVNRLAALTAEIFAPLGFSPKSVTAANPAYGYHLVLRRPWLPGAPTVALISHLDTVFTEAEEAANHFAWRVEGTRIYGPGTNDIKGGTALIDLTLRALREGWPELFARTNFVVLLNACEEIISEDFGQVCQAHLPPDAKACLIFEADGGEGAEFSLVSARKGRATFQIEVEGRGSHAGSQHPGGANAVVQLAEIVTQIARLTDYAAALTVNIGSIQGGTVANRVPHHAEAILEMRAFDPAVYQEARRRILAFNGEGSVRSQDAANVPCRIRVSVDHETVPWPRNAGTDRLVSLWQQTGAELGFIVKTEERGGLSDGNVLWQHFPTVDGLGPRGENSHCSEQSADGSKEQEWVDAASFVPKAVLNAHAIARVIREL